MKLYERIENNNFDEIDRNRAIELIENGNEHLVYNENYFKLQKENEEWQRAYQEEKDKQFDFINKISSNDLIPVQKVKDKIEELKNKPLKIKQNDKYYYETDAYNKIVIQVLQELLEGKKQNV